MKIYKLFLALILGISVVACQPKEVEATTEGEQSPLPGLTAPTSLKEVTPTKAEIDTVSYLLGINFGSFIKGYDFGDINMAQLQKGINDFVNSKGNFRDPDFNEQFKVNPERINDVFNSYLQKRHEYKSFKNLEDGRKYLEANKKKAGIQVTESGLQYKIVEPGNDVKPGPQDTVWVNYKGSLINGDVFDESPEGEPVQLTLNHVISGWTEGLQLIGEGGKIELYIPSSLGYGENGNQSIEPNSTLVFEVETTKVGKFVEAPAE